MGYADHEQVRAEPGCWSIHDGDASGESRLRQPAGLHLSLLVPAPGSGVQGTLNPHETLAALVLGAAHGSSFKMLYRLATSTSCEPAVLHKVQDLNTDLSSHALLAGCPNTLSLSLPPSLPPSLPLGDNAYQGLRRQTCDACGEQERQ